MFTNRKELFLVFNKFNTYLKFRIAPILILFLGHSDSISQNAPDTAFKSIFPKGENGIQYEKVFDLDSSKKADIILRIKEWAIKNFKSQKAALQTEDVESGYLIYQGTINKTSQIPKGWGFGLLESQIVSVDHATKFSINFYVKDFKFKTVITNIELHFISAYGIWYNGTSTNTGTRPYNIEPVPIKDAGNNAIIEYRKHPKEKKYTVRLNFTASLWRDINSQMLAIIESINQDVVIKKNSLFDF